MAMWMMWVLCAGAAEPQWVGEWAQDWRRNPDAGYASVTISDPKGASVAVSYSEGLGVRGQSGSGRGEISGGELVAPLGECTLRARLEGPPAGRTLQVSGCIAEGPVTLWPAASVQHYDASFDCNKASTAVEKAVCANRSLAAVDRALAQRYRAARARDPGTLLADQKAWIATRDKSCAKAELDCLQRSYARRALALSQGGVDTLTFAEVVRLHAEAGKLALRDPVLDAYLSGHTGIWATDLFNLGATAAADARVFSGCSTSGPGYDPLHEGCAQSLYVRIDADNALWVVVRPPHATDSFEVYGPAGATDGAVPEPVRAWMKQEAAERGGGAPSVDVRAVFP